MIHDMIVEREDWKSHTFKEIEMHSKITKQL